MDIHVVKGDDSRIEEYCAVFNDSPLYDHYFKDDFDLLCNWIRKAVSKGELYTAIASDGSVKGVMHMTMEGMCGLPYLNLLGIEKRSRGMGVGTMLVNVFIGVAEAKGYPNMFIMTSEFNVRARKLYQSLGFKKCCLLQSVFKPNINEYLFMRPSSQK